MKEIKLTQGKVALVDDEDYDFLMQWKWYARKIESTNDFYAIRSVDRLKYGKSSIIMHRIILNVSNDLLIDHIDHNGLNNQRHNLRICTYHGNSCNRSSAGRSKYLGVSIKHNGIITAQIRHDGLIYHLGSFKNEIEAALAYDIAAKFYHGEFANLNFK